MTPRPLQRIESSVEDTKTVRQKKGVVLPITSEKPTVELVKITKDMKVGEGTGVRA